MSSLFWAGIDSSGSCTPDDAVKLQETSIARVTTDMKVRQQVQCNRPLRLGRHIRRQRPQLQVAGRSSLRGSGELHTNANSTLSTHPATSHPRSRWANRNTSAIPCSPSLNMSSRSPLLTPTHPPNRTRSQPFKMPSANTRWRHYTTTSPTPPQEK